MTPDSESQLRIDLEEIATDEFFIAVSLRDRKIASLYLRGDRQYAKECLEVVRRRVILTVTGDEPGDTREKVAEEFTRLRDELQPPRR